jgi:hypothetical protein
VIEFIEETHTYLVDGIEVPSATTILSATVFKDKYSGIPQFVMDKAAQFGNGVHKAIETKDYAEISSNDLQLGCILDYQDLLKDNNVEEVGHEIITHYNLDYAGTCDLLIKVNGQLAIADIKTTSKLDKEYLSWQMSFYLYALYDNGLIDTLDMKLHYFWLPKPRYGKAQFGEVPVKSREEVMELVRMYKEMSDE